MGLKGLYLTDRDIDVLKYLAYGPAFSDDLHARFFVKSGRQIHRKNFEKRMRRLQEAGYLQSVRPQRIYGKKKKNNGPIYAVAEGGVEILTNEGGVNVDRIRLVNLDQKTIVHQIILTRLVRKIYEFDGVRYQVVRLYDDAMLLKLAPKTKMQRIPDLRFTVQMRNGSYFSYFVEVDAGSTHASEFVQKPVAFIRANRLLDLANNKEPLIGILVVCDSEDRMRYLQRIVQDSPLAANVKSAIAFNTIFNLDNSLGLFNPWYRANGTKIEMIFKDKRTP